MKIFFKTALLILVSHLTMAQGIEIGAKGSLNLSNVSKFELANTLLGDTKFLPSGGGAIFVEIPLGEGFSFRPEVGYAKRGTKLKNLNIGNWVGAGGIWGSLLNDGIQPRAYLDYIDVPLMVKYKFGQSSAGNGYVLGGPTLGFLVDSGVRVNVLGATNINVPLDYGFNKFEFGGQVGAGYEFPLTGKTKAFVEATYKQGFTNIIEDRGMFQFRSRNNNLGISAGISIPLGN
jgi:hypothetical protein